jgi:uncharacterized metal-binding protein YceD (DUF177 family)
MDIRVQFDGKEEFEFDVDPKFVDADLDFTSVHVVGESSVEDDLLVITFEASTSTYIPCSICNTPTPIDLKTELVHHTIPLTEIKGQIFDISELVREEIILIIPQFIECHDGNCPVRPLIAAYTPKKDRHPFAYL